MARSSKCKKEDSNNSLETQQVHELELTRFWQRGCYVMAHTVTTDCFDPLKEKTPMRCTCPNRIASLTLQVENLKEDNRQLRAAVALYQELLRRSNAKQDRCSTGRRRGR